MRCSRKDKVQTGIGVPWTTEEQGIGKGEQREKSKSPPSHPGHALGSAFIALPHSQPFLGLT